MLYRPTTIAVGGLLAWGLLWLILPVEVVGYLSPTATVYILLCYLGLALGVALGRAPGERRLPLPAWRLPEDKPLFWTTLGIGLFGLGLRLYDRVVLRGVSYGGDALELRETLAESGVSLIGAAGAVLYVFCLLPLMILLVTRSDRPRRFAFLLALAVFLLPMIESFAQLSRSFMLVTIGFGFGVAIIGRFRGNPLDRRILLSLVGTAVVIGVASTAIFNTRLDLAQRALSDSIFESVYAENLQPNARARLALLGGTNEAEAQFYQTILPNGMYYLSGMYEFTLLWDRPDDQPFSYGALHFYPFLRVVQLANPEFFREFDEPSYVYRSGAWQTFFGPLWVDFGWFGLVVMALIGFLTERLGSLARRQSLVILPLYIYMIVVIFFMPVVNLLTSGFGFFTIAGFSIYAFALASLRPNKVPAGRDVPANFRPNLSFPLRNSRP